MFKSNLVILFLEDSEEDYELISRAIRKHGIAYSGMRVSTIEEFIDQIKFNPPDLVVSDYNLDNLTGLDALQIVQDKSPETPFIVISGYIGEEKAVEFLKKGAKDYISKNNLEKLPVAIERNIREMMLRGEKKNAQKKLDQEIERNRKLISAMSEGLVLLDERNQIIFSNHAFQKMIGYSEKELSKMKWSQLIDKTDKFPQLIGVESHNEDQLLHKSGKRIWVEIRRSDITEEKEHRVIKVISDKTLERESEAKLKELNSEMEQLIYRASHDLRGPISSMEGLMEIVKSDGLDDELLQAFSKMVDESYQILDSLTLVTEFQHHPLTVETIFIRPLIVELVEALFTETANLVSFDLTHKDVYTDYTALKTILRNILDNCLKHGVVKNQTLEVLVRTKSVGHYIEISISDNGPGIAENHRASIFDLFYRANAAVRSSGLGLYLSKKIAKRLGGDLYLSESDKGTGATFTLKLPDPLNKG